MRRPITGLQNAPFLPRTRRDRRLAGGTIGSRLGWPAPDTEQGSTAGQTPPGLTGENEGTEDDNG